MEKIILEIDKENFLKWRISTDSEHMELATDIINLMLDNNTITYSINNLFYNLGYLPCRLINNLNEIDFSKLDYETIPTKDDEIENINSDIFKVVWK